MASSIFIDSGEHTGVARFEEDHLLSVGLTNRPWPSNDTLCVLELPAARKGGHRGQVNVNSLILTAARGGFSAGHNGPRDVRYVLPEWWKGQLPKDITEARAREVLSAKEVGIIETDLAGVAKSLKNNVWDAVAMGLVWHGRIRGMRIKQSKPLFRKEGK